MLKRALTMAAVLAVAVVTTFLSNGKATGSLGCLACTHLGAKEF